MNRKEIKKTTMKNKVKNKSLYVKTKYACGLIELDKDNIIILTPPIWNRYKGKHFDRFKRDHEHGSCECKWRLLRNDNRRSD